MKVRRLKKYEVFHAFQHQLLTSHVNYLLTNWVAFDIDLSVAWSWLFCKSWLLKGNWHGKK